MPTMQHDLFANPNPRSRAAYPFVVILQADLAEGDRRIVAPVVPRTGPLASQQNRVLPVVTHEGREFMVLVPLLGSLPTAQLKTRLDSMAAWRDDITRALDWLLWGV